MRGNWRDLRTVFNAAGLTPRTPPASPQVAPSEKEEATSRKKRRHKEHHSESRVYNQALVIPHLVLSASKTAKDVKG